MTTNPPAHPVPRRGRIALAMGCPAGIAPELTARVLADADLAPSCDLTVYGDRRVLDRGAQVAGVRVSMPVVRPGEEVGATGSVFVDLGHLDPDAIPVGETSPGAGRFAIETFRRAIRHAQAGHAEVVAFTPFNKAGMRLAHPAYDDELTFLNETLSFEGVTSEFNVLPGLWNARVTSHVPLSGVARLITKERVLRSLRLTDRAMREGGFDAPRIAVAALNPHAGDGGNFGREEIDEIAPAVAAGRAEGLLCEGPYPSDTVFMRARRGDHDAVLTMYHDQGQIAMKLIGFDQGVTLLGGYPFPLVTAAHGSAYDIAGRGLANPGAMREAIALGARMAAARATGQRAV